MIYCFGDSITKGSPGVSYLKYLSSPKDCQNQGVGGETVSGLTLRLKQHMKKHDDPHYILQIGTNDILLPYLERQSPKWKKRLTNIKKRGGRPSTTEIQFNKSYQELVDLMKKRKKKIILINIPVIGEDLQHSRNRKVEKYNGIIRAIAQKEGIPLIDYYGWQGEQLTDHQEKKHFFIGEDPKQVVFDVFRTMTGGGRKNLSRKRNLHLTVDGVHLNDAGARGLASLVEKEMTKVMR